MIHRRSAAVRTTALFGGGGGGNQPGGGGGGNPFANMGNLMESVKKAQQMVQVETAKLQQELAVAEIEGFSSDETVRVVMSGQQEPKSVDITQEAYAQGQEVLERLVLEAVKDAHTKSVGYMKTQMGQMAQKLGLPPGGLL